MANEINFKSKLLPTANGQKFLASRVFTNNLDSLLELQLPTEVPSEFDVEISLYSLADNSLIYNRTFSSSEENLFNVYAITYDGTLTPNERRMLFIDFSKISFPFQSISGKYQIVLNFFVREIGAFNTQSLYITNISNSGRELQLKLRPNFNTQLNRQKLYAFASPAISNEWVVPVVKQIFNQPNSQNLKAPTDNTVLTYSIIESFFSQNTKATMESNEVPATTKAEIRLQIQNILNNAYGIAIKNIEQQLINNTVRFTEDNLIKVVSASISAAIQDGTTSKIVFT